MGRPRKQLELKKGNLTVEQQDNLKNAENLIKGNSNKLKMPNWVTDKESQKDYADEMRKFAGLCGLTFDSRAKIADVKIEQEKDKVGNKFGDI